MEYRFFLVLAPITVLLLVVVLALLWKFKSEPTARALAWYALLCIWLIVMNSAEQLASTKELTLLFAKLSYISFLLLPLSFARFCLRYTGHDKYFPAALWEILIITALLCYVMVITNDLHHLFWREIKFVEVQGLLIMKSKYGPFFWLTAGYCWSIMSMAMIFVLRAYNLRLGLHRLRSIWILIGLHLPAVANFIYVLKLAPAIQKDYTPIGFGFSVIAFFIGAFMVRAIKIVPMARGVVLEELDEGYIFLDTSGRLTDYNRYAGCLLHISDSMIGKLFSDLPQLELLDRAFVISAEEKSMFASGETISWTIHQNENVYLIKLRVIYGKSGSRGTAILISDITERSKMQFEIETARANILKRERFAVIGRLAADIAHEINNPLGFVWSDFRSLQAICKQKEAEGCFTQEAKEILQEIGEGLSRIDCVVKSLLEYSRRGAKLDYAPAPYDIAQGILAAIELARGDFDRFATIELEMEQVPQIIAKGNEIDQVILNIIRNAVDAVRERFCPELKNGQMCIDLSQKSGLIHVSLYQDGSDVVCEISNNGPPIRQEDAERIFEAFFSTKDERRGTGLGLSIAREIIEEHHKGTLRLKQCDPVTFEIRLPINSENTQ
ncbi:MAG TPA: histidine kinase N-terminal 7TM domain-containing protein [Spirochaetales bacterium]|nr:histidine kinase N-terminal 7TM domain-containing protein [Spirochaetales bacterium]